jgi:diguanylate cyclase (GGDEF)-like protein/PAS domain S-box-containing protein
MWLVFGVFSGIAVAAPSDLLLAQADLGQSGLLSASDFDQESSFRLERAEVLLQGMLLGLLLGLAAYHLAKYLYAQSPKSMPTALLLLCTFVFEFVVFGYHEGAVGPASRQAFIVQAIAGGLLASTGIQFLRSFLDLRAESPLYDTIARVLFFLALFSIALAAFNPLVALGLAQFAMVSGVVAACFMVVALSRGGAQDAHLIGPGVLFIAIAAGLVLAVKITGISVADWWELSVQVLFVIGLLLLSYAVSTAHDAAANPLRIQYPSALPPPRPSKSVARSTGIDTESPRSGIRPPERRIALAMAAAREGLWDWNITDRLLYLSPETEVILGLRTGDFDGTEEAWIAYIHDEDRERFGAKMLNFVQQGDVSFLIEFRIVRPSGEEVWVELKASCINGEEGEATRCIGLLQDVSERKTDEADLLRASVFDSLTGLFDRVAFVKKTAEAVAVPMTDDGYGALLLVDLDRFQTVNEGLGHTVGDKLLSAVASRLSAFIGMQDVLGRLGGDEFAILLGPCAEERTAKETGELLLEVFAQPFDVDGREVFLAASIGVATRGEAHKRAEDLLNDAEVALYQAKRSGRARTVEFTSRMRGHTDHTASMEADLRRALEREEIELHYQPIIDLADNRLAGFEALLRWRHTSRGVLTADQFVDLAEETGLIVSFGKFALAMASVQLYQWQTFFPTGKPLFTSVNMSSRELLRPDLVTDVREVLSAVAIAPGSLKLELTESQVLHNEDLASDVVAQLKALGAGLALDDFGTGYSTLSRLNRFAFDTLKVDRSFVASMSNETESPVITKTIVELAHELEMDVVAEGVESEQDVKRLKDMGCEFGQGFYFGAPMLASDAQAFIAEHWSD